MSIFCSPARFEPDEVHTWTKFDIERLFQYWLVTMPKHAQQSHMGALWSYKDTEWDDGTFPSEVNIKSIRSALKKDMPKLCKAAVAIFLDEQVRSACNYLQQAISSFESFKQEYMK